MQYCDLHTHSNYSDGTFTPAELIAEAEKIGLSAVALTDHNTVSGLPEFLSAAEGKKVKAVAGIEISTDYGKTELHIVGLFIKPEYFARVEEFTEILLDNKEACNRELIKRLNDAGYAISFDEIKAKTANGRFNRAHIGEALAEKGYVGSITEAFDTLLAKNSEYYVPTKRVGVFEAIEFLKSVEATAVLAHSFLDLTEEELLTFLPKAKAHGLDAMETYYLNYNEETINKACEIADRHGLLHSGGSDFHGARKPNVLLGRGVGEHTVPHEIYERLKTQNELSDI